MSLFNISLTGKQKKEDVQNAKDEGTEQTKDTTQEPAEEQKNIADASPKPKREPRVHAVSISQNAGWTEVTSTAGSPMIKIIEESPLPPRVGDLQIGRAHV